MWDVGGDLIQLELGSHVIREYSSSRKNDCDLLIKQISQLRNKLSANNIVLPPVRIRDASDLLPDEYKLYMGILFQTDNYRKNSPVDVLAYLAQQFCTDSYSYDSVKKIFESGVKYIASEEKDYQKAVMEFVKAYFCASIGTDTYAIMINSAINICGIQVLNGNLDLALLDAQRAVYASMMTGFCDPYIKYHAQIWLAIIYVKSNNNGNALKCLLDAYHVIEETDSSRLKVNSLWAAAYISIKQGDIAFSIKALDTIVEIIDEDHAAEYDPKFCISLMKFIRQISNIQISSLEKELDILRDEYARISQKFSFKLGNTVLNVVQKVGPTLITTCVGSLLSGTNNYASGDIIYGTNVKIMKE